MTAEEIADRLHAKSSGAGKWKACCPAHHDRNPSLSIGEGDDGRVLLKCFAGCTHEQIVAGLGLGVDDLYPPAERPIRRQRKPDTRRPVGEGRRWDIADADGKVVGRHVRRDFVDAEGVKTKTFSWVDHRCGAGEMPLYNLPAHLAAPQGVLRIVCEGEKATDALNEAVRRAERVDVLALATVTGASAIPCDESLRPLIGYRVAVWPDNDDVGHTHMERIAKRLQGIGQPAPRWINWADAPAKGDADDYFAAGGTVDGMLAFLDDEAMQAAGQPKMPTHAIDAHSRHRASMGILDDEGHLRRGFILLSGVTPEQVTWGWQGRIPLGKLTVVDGNPDLGKSLVFGADIPARVTMGAMMPDGTPGFGEPAGVVLLSAEDEPADTIVPRLIAAGADLSRVLTIQSVPRMKVNEDGTVEPEEGSFFIPRDLEWLRRSIEHVHAKYVLIDPLMAYLHPGEVNSYRDQDVRTALAPLARLASEMDAAIVAIRHLNKGAAASPLYRGGGSIGIIGAARSGLIVAEDPDDAEKKRRILARSKGNLSAPVPALAYHIEVTPDGVPFIAWEGETEHTAAQLLALPMDGEVRSETDEAVEWLRSVLENAGGQMAAKDVQAKAKQEGVSDKVLRSARLRICEKPTKEGFGADGGWQWRLTPKMPSIPKVPKDAHMSQQGIFGEGGHLRGGVAPVCMVCRAPKHPLPDGGYELTCTCGKGA